MMKYSIVIPTRERCETLLFTLRTCVEQDYAPLEIIVSDNDSADDTRAVVESFADPRIRYVNTGRRVSMTRNWEFGLSHVTGDFVTFVGDDDGLLPNAVADAAALVQRFDAQAVSWRKADYCWPNHPRSEYANVLIIPLVNRLFDVDAKRFLTDVATFWTSYHRGPSFYNAFVSVEAARRVQARSGGTFFHSVIPDAYSALVLPSELDRYLFSHRPFSVNGASGRSNGANTDSFLKGNENSETGRFLEEQDLPLHPKLPVLIIGSVLALVLESLLHANDVVYGGRLPIRFDAALGKIVRDASFNAPERYASVTSALLEAFRGRPHEERVVRAAMRRHPNRPRPQTGLKTGLGADETYTADAAAVANITNVHEAARFVAALLGPYTPPAKISRYSHFSKVVTRAMSELQSRASRLVW